MMSDKARFFENWMGKVFVAGEIEAVTGLHIGGSATGLDIGGIDNIIIRDEITRRPYIPGSSLKGKMRSLLERSMGKPLEEVIRGRVWQHQCRDTSPCELCKVFGLPGEEEQSEPTRLIVRDAHLEDMLCVTEPDGSRQRILWTDARVRTDLPFSENKTEVTLDRITAAAVPRQVERVPAGALFGYSFVFDVYEEADKDHLKLLFQAMDLLEGDYLGGYGTRGSGQIRFETIQVTWKSKEAYASGGIGTELQNLPETPADLVQQFEAVVKNQLCAGAEGNGHDEDI